MFAATPVMCSYGEIKLAMADDFATDGALSHNPVVGAVTEPFPTKLCLSTNRFQTFKFYARNNTS